MKRVFCLLISLSLFFCACQGKTESASSLLSAATRVQNALGGKESFYEADEDFIADNFGELPYVQEAKVFLGCGEKMQEFGIFRLTDRQKASELKMILKDYLATEKEALTSLSALYPAEELSARLAAYEGAHVGSEGMLVYYFVLECAQAKVALEALNGR